MSKFKVGQLWKTRNGLTVDITSVHNTVVIGRVTSLGQARTWCIDGNYLRDKTHELDLVEQTVAVKPKKDTTVKPKGTPEPDMLSELEAILGERGAQYGAADKNFTDIAEQWELYCRQYWERNPDMEGKFDKHMVASMMILLKLCRNHQGQKRDSWLDIAGYACRAGDFE